MNPFLKVLLVEDSAVLTQRLIEALGEIAGVESIDAVDAETKAWALLQQQRFDVVLLDLQLKQGTGFGLLRALAALERKPHVVVLTNYDATEYETAARELGATHFLDKARDLHQLPNILRGMLEHRRDG